jgi:hypothetical protein
MGYVEIILTVCMLSSPTVCEERRIPLDSDGSPAQCARAQPVIAAWIGNHPDWAVERWTCSDRRKRDI